MNAREKMIVSVAGGGIFIAIGIGLIVTTVGLSSLGNRLRTPPITQSQSVGNVSVTIHEPIEATPAVMTTEQLAAEIGCNADTVRRRYADGRLYGFEKLDRDAWVRLGYGSCMVRAFDVHEPELGI